MMELINDYNNFFGFDFLRALDIGLVLYSALMSGMAFYCFRRKLKLQQKYYWIRYSHLKVRRVYAHTIALMLVYSFSLVELYIRFGMSIGWRGPCYFVAFGIFAYAQNGWYKIFRAERIAFDQKLAEVERDMHLSGAPDKQDLEDLK